MVELSEATFSAVWCNLVFLGEKRSNENPMIKVIFTKNAVPTTEEIHFSSGTGSRQRLVIRFPWFLRRVADQRSRRLTVSSFYDERGRLNLLGSMGKFFITPPQCGVQRRKIKVIIVRWYIIGPWYKCKQ